MSARVCEHRVVLLGNRDLSCGWGVCAECVERVTVDVRDPQWIPVFAVVRSSRGEDDHEPKAPAPHPDDTRRGPKA